MTALRKSPPSRDEWRAIRKEVSKAQRGDRVSVSLRPASRDRLNELKRILRVEDQSMAVDVIYIRVTGGLEVPR